MQRLTSAIYGCSGLELTDWEASFFKDQRPFGYILFGRNIESPAQVQELTIALREASGDPDAPIFVDQEGGTVARFKRPHFRHPPAPRRFMELAEKCLELAAEAAWLNARLMAEELKELGINANCAPMLDVVQPTAHEFLRQRALGSDPETVATLGRAVSVAFRDGGIAPCIKHAPGHGRAKADSHHDLPTVDVSTEDLEREDFKPFLALMKEPMLMTAHVIYRSLDPEAPATQSSKIIRGLIREEWGYNGLIITDDINMNALEGSIEDRSRRALEAGCEVICHCNGDRSDMEAVARASIALEADALDHALRARDIANKEPKPFDRLSAEERLKELGLFEEEK